MGIPQTKTSILRTEYNKEKYNIERDGDSLKTNSSHENPSTENPSTEKLDGMLKKTEEMVHDVNNLGKLIIEETIRHRTLRAQLANLNKKEKIA